LDASKDTNYQNVDIVMGQQDKDTNYQNVDIALGGGFLDNWNLLVACFQHLGDSLMCF
jgi:hypothetical protein